MQNFVCSADSVEVEDDSDNEFPNVSLSCEGESITIAYNIFSL